MELMPGVEPILRRVRLQGMSADSWGQAAGFQ